jgi:hypothetical protein
MARDQRRAELAKEVIDTLADEFVALMSLAERFPEEGAGEEAMRLFRQESWEHHLRIMRGFARLPDDELRERLDDLVPASLMAFQGTGEDWQARRLAAHNLPNEAFTLLGARVREEPLPPPSPDLAEALRRRYAS